MERLELSKLLLNMRSIETSSYGRRSGIKYPNSITYIDSIKVVTPKKVFGYVSENEIERICNRFLEIDPNFFNSISKELNKYRDDYYDTISGKCWAFESDKKAVELKTKVKEISLDGFPIWEWKDKNENIITRDDALYILYENNFIPLIMHHEGKESGLIHYFYSPCYYLDSPRSHIEYFINEIKDVDITKSKRLKKFLEKKIKEYLNTKKEAKIRLKDLNKDIFYLKNYIQKKKLSDKDFKILNLNRKEINELFKRLFDIYTWFRKDQTLEKIDSLIEEPVSLALSKGKQMKYLRELAKH